MTMGDQNLYTWLRQYKRFGGGWTHTSMAGEHKGTYLVPPHATGTLYELYVKALADGVPVHINEKHPDVIPLLIDLDFRMTTVTRGYTAEHVQRIVEAYMRQAERLVECQGAEIFVMEKPCPREETKKDGTVIIKDGLHIVVPGVVTTEALQLLLRARVLPLLEPILRDIGITNTPKDCVDEGVITKTGWLMYGSCKAPGAAPYLVTKVFRWGRDGASPVELRQSEAQLVRLLSLHNKTEVNTVLPGVQQEVDAFAPAKPPHRQVTASTTGTNECSDIDLMRRFVSFLSPDRADAEDSWMRVGFCLRNIDHRLLPDWIEFSRKSHKFEEGICEARWERLRVTDGLGVGSLRKWAAEDSPAEFRDAQESDIEAHMKVAARNCTHFDVAHVVHKLYQDRFVCASPKSRSWYSFENHRWEPCEEGIVLSMLMSRDVCAMFMDLSSKVTKNAAQKEDNEGELKLAKSLLNVALKLKNTGFKQSVLQECNGLFFKARFEELLNSKVHLLGFKNGVYDMDKNEFRDGLPEDCISFSTHISYIPYDVTCPQHAELTTYLEQVFPQPDVRRYVLMHLASCLHGQVREERFHIWNAGGSNGKSVCIDLFEKTLGDYCCKFPVSLLTNKRAVSNAATSEIARAKGRRFVCLQEPSEDERLNLGLMKELSGGDRIIARSLFKEPIEFKPQFKMILVCNHIPEISATDVGTWRRLRIVEFVSRFTDDPVEGVPNQFPIDVDLGAKMRGWVEHFMSMLINDCYQEYRSQKYKLFEPPQVKEATAVFQQVSDDIGAFIKERIERSEGDFLSLKEAFAVFKDWMSECNIQRHHQQKEFEGLMRKRWGALTKLKGSSGWSNWRAKLDVEA
jgi:P4 family phage/plasmid primase-like protien